MSNRRRARRRGGTCTCGCGATDVVAVPPDQLVDYFERTRTPDDGELMAGSLAAEAEGDAQAALDLYRQAPHIVRAPHELYLRELIALGAAAPSWVVNRWVVRQASLWMLLGRDPRTDDAVRLTLMTCYEPDEDLDSAGLVRLGTQVAACDWVYAELALHEMSGLDDYVHLVAGAALLERTARLQDWLDAPLRPYRYDGIDGGAITATDLVTGRRLQLLDIGAMVGADVGQHMLGRAVPIEQAPGLMLETRPLYVDQQTALDAATRRRTDLLPSWLIANGCGIDDGRLPYAVGRMGGTPLSSDVPHDRFVGGAVA